MNTKQKIEELSETIDILQQASFKLLSQVEDKELALTDKQKAFLKNVAITTQTALQVTVRGCVNKDVNIENYISLGDSDDFCTQDEFEEDKAKAIENQDDDITDYVYCCEECARGAGTLLLDMRGLQPLRIVV